MKTFYINIFAGINHPTANNLMAMCTQLHQQHKAEKLYFMISSPGGEVRSGVALYNFLKSLPVHIVMHNMGAIDSIATAIFMAGDDRYACPGSSFLFHGVKTTFNQNAQVSPNQLKEILSSIERDQHKIIEVIASNCEMTEGEMNDLFLQGESKDLDFALSKKIIDDVCIPEIPAEGTIINLKPGN